MVTVAYQYILEMGNPTRIQFYCRFEAILPAKLWIRNVYNFQYLCVPELQTKYTSGRGWVIASLVAYLMQSIINAINSTRV